MVEKYEVEISGLTPLIMHRDNIEWADMMDDWKADPANKKKSKAGDDRTPAWRWIGCLYHDEKYVTIGAGNIARCMMEGGAMVPVPGAKGNKTFKAQTQSGMKVDALHVPFFNKGKKLPLDAIDKLRDIDAFPEQIKAVKEQGFGLIVLRAAVSGKKHVRVRPIFEEWSSSFTLSVWDEQLTPEIIHSILTLAGTYKGLCDWRPGSKTPGSYGVFKVDRIEKV